MSAAPAPGEIPEDQFVAGRVMLPRSMGKAAFAELRDATDRLQLYLGWRGCWGVIVAGSC